MKAAITIVLIIFILSGCTMQSALPPDTRQGEKTAVESQPPKAETSAPPQSAETPPPVETPSPTPSKEPQVIGEYSTKIVDNTPSRLENLRLACEFINGTIIAPGEEFSFNDTVGPRTKERGFEKGYVFVGKKKTQAIGGGVCQVSSTIFNAARNANMEITERHPHQRSVAYVKRGDDATVSYGSLDFRFRNSAENDVKMEALIDETLVTVRLWEIL